MSAPEFCRYKDEIDQYLALAKPALDTALAGLDMMIDSAAAMNREGRGLAMFDQAAAQELERINDVTARSMTHRSEVEEAVAVIRSEYCIEGASCKETCQKIGEVTRLAELLNNSPI